MEKKSLIWLPKLFKIWKWAIYNTCCFVGSFSWRMHTSTTCFLIPDRKWSGATTSCMQVSKNSLRTVTPETDLFIKCFFLSSTLSFTNDKWWESHIVYSSPSFVPKHRASIAFIPSHRRIWRINDQSRVWVKDAWHECISVLYKVPGSPYLFSWQKGQYVYGAPCFVS